MRPKAKAVNSKTRYFFADLTIHLSYEVRTGLGLLKAVRGGQRVNTAEFRHTPGEELPPEVAEEKATTFAAETARRVA